MTVDEMVEKYLRENGYDGLVNADAECDCPLDDIRICGEAYGDCEAAYKVKCDESCDDVDHGGWHFQSTKPAKDAHEIHS